MSENLKTIKELADELGVSKQTIHYHIKSLSNIKRDKNNKGAVLLNEEEQKFIYSKVNAVKDDTVKDDTVKGNTVKGNTVKDDTVKGNTVKDNTVKDNTAHFLSEIQFLRTQLENKDTQILQMQNLLDQQQRLALQDKKLLEEYKSEINELKALKMPQEDMKDGSSIRGEAQEEIERLKVQLKLSEEERNKAKEKEPVKTESKKWWQLWK
ncbi:HTH domain-containing protein [Lactococcus cremoris]|uniref:HTH domain-containing protein n=2 Tax=Lactococcus lactis subsp. cremoris TaxID=1359 RepID=UPI0024A76CC6|nr:HTH domain-containing protein [Lactococcus cremoris]